MTTTPRHLRAGAGRLEFDMNDALRHLRRGDPALARIIRRAGACTLQPKATQSLFHALAESITRVVRSGGRVVGPATRALPAGVREIVRDDRLWVAEKIAAPVDPTPRLVTLKRA